MIYELAEPFWDDSEIYSTLNREDNDGVSLVRLNLNHDKSSPGSNILIITLKTEAFEKVVWDPIMKAMRKWQKKSWRSSSSHSSKPLLRKRNNRHQSMRIAVITMRVLIYRL